MTKARLISQGERTQERALDVPADEPFDDDGNYVGGEYEAPAQPQPDRMCKRCDNAAEDDTAYGVVIAKSGLGHYTASAGTTICGLDITDW